jgi:hypothetical protein
VGTVGRRQPLHATGKPGTGGPRVATVTFLAAKYNLADWAAMAVVRSRALPRGVGRAAERAQRGGLAPSPSSRPRLRLVLRMAEAPPPAPTRADPHGTWTLPRVPEVLAPPARSRMTRSPYEIHASAAVRSGPTPRPLRRAQRPRDPGWCCSLCMPACELHAAGERRARSPSAAPPCDRSVSEAIHFSRRRRELSGERGIFLPVRSHSVGAPQGRRSLEQVGAWCERGLTDRDPSRI